PESKLRARAEAAVLRPSALPVAAEIENQALIEAEASLEPQGIVARPLKRLPRSEVALLSVANPVVVRELHLRKPEHRPRADRRPPTDAELIDADDVLLASGQIPARSVLARVVDWRPLAALGSPGIDVGVDLALIAVAARGDYRALLPQPVEVRVLARLRRRRHDGAIASHRARLDQRRARGATVLRRRDDRSRARLRAALRPVHAHRPLTAYPLRPVADDAIDGGRLGLGFRLRGRHRSDDPVPART